MLEHHNGPLAFGTCHCSCDTDNRKSFVATARMAATITTALVTRHRDVEFSN